MEMRRFITIVSLLLAIAVISSGFGPALAQDRTVGWGKGQDRPIGQGKGNVYGKMRSTTPAQREKAAANARAKGLVLGEFLLPGALAPVPGGVPDYFGPYPNYATSPHPVGFLWNIVVNNGGFGYSANPNITITDAYGAGSGATAGANVINGVINAIIPITRGSGYIAPVVTITDATGDGAIATALVNPAPGTGMRKFVDALPNLTIATPTACTYSDQEADCYEIWEVEYRQQMHSDLPPVSGIWPNQTGGTLLRGYVQVDSIGNFVAPPSYLGPVIVVQRDKPVRVKFVNKLPTGSGGDLFIPVDTSYMGAGLVPEGDSYSATEMYTQNRTAIHLHGATTPWISDGTVFQWFTPADETTTSYPKGVSVANVPDMGTDCEDPNSGCMTFYYTNEQSARLMFYHDHAAGITRLNVYAGLAAGYLVSDADPTRDPITPIFGEGFPLIIQDKTFVPSAAQLAAQDPTWNSGSGSTVLAANGSNGDLWFPHVYMTNQNPWDVTGANAMGRWDYGPWFWPPFTNLLYGPIPNPYCQPTPPEFPTSTDWDCSATPWEPPFIPGVPTVSGVPESFMDTPIVNGMAYPRLNVPAEPVRFRILCIGNDRYLNLSLWVADPSTVYPSRYIGPGNTEVKMLPFNSSQNLVTPFPTWWYDFEGYISGTVPNPFDDRIGGVPDPAMRGPAMIQIATEGGFLPAPVVIKNQPINYVMNKRDITIGNVKEKALFLGPAERADVIVDFTNFAGKTLILYNDAPAPVPAADPRLDYFTGNRDQTSTGGPPSTLPGYGPNTRTIMQIVVAGSGGTAPADDIGTINLANLKTALEDAFAASQDTIIVPQHAYDGIYGTTTTDTPGVNIVRIQDTSMAFTPLGQTTPVTFDFYPKSIIEDFQMDYGRMNAVLGVEIPHTNNTNQTSILQNLVDPPTEIIKISDPSMTPIGTMADGTQIWKVTHNGVDTHVMHVHMFTAQIVNRVGWDGAMRLPDPNELGFKDTIRMNPLEDAIIALRPIKLMNIPFKVPNSWRLMAPMSPEHAILGPTGMPLFQGVDPNGLPVDITNEIINFGWEYVWHCHILGHEENDMMRPMALAAPPEAPSDLSASLLADRVSLAWTDNSVNATGFTLQRATDPSFPEAGLETFMIGNVTPNPQTFDDTTILLPTPPTYYYRVLASNTVGSFVPNYPQVTADSGFSNIATTAPGLFFISGTVTSGATGLAGVTMNLTGTASATTTTAADGTYSFTGLANGSYTVTPTLAGYTFAPTSSAVPVSGANVTGVDFTATPVTYSISGTVTSGATGLAGVTMNLTGTASATTSTAADGTYSFTGLANGSYTVTPTLAGYTFAPTSSAVPVSGANVTGQDFTGTLIPTTYSISGKVTTRPRGSLPGTPIAGVRMTLTGAASATTITNGNGDYSFSGLNNGAYTVTPRLRGYTFTPTSRAVIISGADITGQNFIGR